MAAAGAYLAADESGHVTGASIPIDGGYLSLGGGFALGRAPQSVGI